MPIFDATAGIMEHLVEKYHSHWALAIYARPSQIAAAEVLHDF
jgi:hypothetical protein